MSLEQCAESVLLDAMHNACQNFPKIAASFAVLVGSNSKDSTTPKSPEMSVLLGQEDNIGDVDIALSRQDLL